MNNKNKNLVKDILKVFKVKGVDYDGNIKGVSINYYPANVDYTWVYVELFVHTDLGTFTVYDVSLDEYWEIVYDI